MPLRRGTIALLLGFAVACASAGGQPAITRDRAIAIARAQVKWEPFEVDARRATSNGVPIWRITLKGRLPGQPPPFVESSVVEIDAATGQILSVSKT